MKTWLQKRRERRRQRRRFEEIAAWIILPIILLFCWGIGSAIYPMVKDQVHALMRGPSRAP